MKKSLREVNDAPTSAEMYKLKNQLEDANYINEKLRKDRAEVLARNDILERDLRDLKSKISKQVKAIEEYYQKKMEIHASIYKEEIQNIITTFNDNSTINTQIMRQLI